MITLFPNVSGVARRCASAALFLTATSGVLGAQHVSGSVLNTVSGLPIGGAVVSLVSGDSTFASTVTNAQGRFDLLSNTSRATTVFVRRLGFKPSRTAVQETAVEIRLSPIAWTLAPTVTLARRECAERADAGQASVLWEQLQTALLAARVAREASAAQAQVIFYSREVDLTTVGKPRIDTQSTRYELLSSLRPFRAAHPPIYFIANGYARRGVRGSPLYGPDEETLLDSSFALTHCFGVSTEVRAGRIGLTFEPTSSRNTRADIRGTLWVDSAHAVLEGLEFSYANLDIPDASDRFAGGALQFGVGPGGSPFVASWFLRGPQRGTTNPEVGGHVVSALWEDSTHWAAELPRLSGRVLDASTGEPRRDVPLRLVNGDRVTMTDAEGRFSFESLLPGPYLLAIDDTLTAVFRAVLDVGEASIVTGDTSTSTPANDWFKRKYSRIKERPLAVPLDVRADTETVVTIKAPTVSEALRRSCGAALTDSSAVLALWLLEGELPMRGIGLKMAWIADHTLMKRTIRTDDRGRAILCGVPKGGTVEMEGAASVPISAADGVTFRVIHPL